MKMLIFFFLSLILLGCTGVGCSNEIIHSDDFVGLVWFSGDIIDLEREQIFSKKELIKHIDTIPSLARGRLSVLAGYDGVRYIIMNVNPLQNNEPLLRTSNYKSGMPIVLVRSRQVFSGNGRDISTNFSSEQAVILVKGDPVFWADSSFRHGNRVFTILPVSDGTENAVLGFRYTIRER